MLLVNVRGFSLKKAWFLVLLEVTMLEVTMRLATASCATVLLRRLAQVWT